MSLKLFLKTLKFEFVLRESGIGHIHILTVVLEMSMKERLMQGHLFKCKLFSPHEPPSYAHSSPTMRIRIRSIAFHNFSAM